MRNPKFKAIRPNYRKRVFEITLRGGKRVAKYSLPFAVFHGRKIGTRNRVISVTIEKELAEQGAVLCLEDGSIVDFPADFVLYYCDPSYDWSPLNQLKKALKNKLGLSRLSVRVLADALSTSPSQVSRLLEENKGSKQFLQLFRLAQLAGYEIEINLKKKAA